MVDGGIGPFAQAGLDEAFGFAVGARSVGPGEDVFDTQLVEEGRDGLRAVSRAIVAHELADTDAEGGEVRQGLAQELGDAADLLIRHDLGVGHARSVINSDVDELPTGAGEVIVIRPLQLDTLR